VSRNPSGNRLWRSAARIVLGAARPLLPAFPELDASERSQVEGDLGDFLQGQIRAMPQYLRGPYLLALFGFEYLPLLRYGQPYTALRSTIQERIVRSWSESRIAPMRDFVKLIRTCALFYYLDHSVVRAQLEADVEGPAASMEVAHGN
jgi:hypothetical protein